MKKLTLIGLVILAPAFLVFVSCANKESDTPQVDMATTELPSLQAALDEKKNQFELNASEEVKSIFNEGVAAVAVSGVMESALGVGDTAFDFTLPNATGSLITLSEILKAGPVILTWYRGGW